MEKFRRPLDGGAFESAADTIAVFAVLLAFTVRGRTPAGIVFARDSSVQFGSLF